VENSLGSRQQGLKGGQKHIKNGRKNIQLRETIESPVSPDILKKGYLLSSLRVGRKKKVKKPSGGVLTKPKKSKRGSPRRVAGAERSFKHLQTTGSGGHGGRDEGVRRGGAQSRFMEDGRRQKAPFNRR